MKKRAIFASVACVLSLVLLTGCAIFRKGPSDDELVMQQVQSLVDDLLAGNVDNILDYVSEDFSHRDVADKASLADYVEMGKDMGYIDDLPALIEEHDGEISLEDAEVTVDGDMATVYPIEASAIEGSVTVELTFKKDPDGVWRIIGADVEGI